MERLMCNSTITQVSTLVLFCFVTASLAISLCSNIYLKDVRQRDVITYGQVNGRPAGPANRKYALSNRCTSTDREAINRCEDEARRDWDVRDTDYYTPTRKFCCFAWDTLSCELRIAQRCDPNYAAELSYLTEQSYSSFCEYHSRRSASCALRWWSVMLIIIAILIIIGIVLFVVYRKRQSKFTYDYETVTRK